MADIAIQMGVNGPEDDVDGIMSIFNYVYQQDPKTDDVDFVFEALEDDFSNGAVGILSSMTFILNYIGSDSTKKTYISPVLRSFERITIEGKNAVRVIIPAQSRKLLRLIFEQRDFKGDEKALSDFIQSKAEGYGFL